MGVVGLLPGSEWSGTVQQQKPYQRFRLSGWERSHTVFGCVSTVVEKLVSIRDANAYPKHVASPACVADPETLIATSKLAP